MKNFLKSIAVTICLIGIGAALSACVNDVSAPPQPLSLAQVQTSAKTVLQVVTADVNAYETANPMLAASTKGDLDQAVKDLGDAVANLNSLQPGASYQSEVTALLNVLNDVVANLPDSVLSSNTKLAVQGGIGLAQALLTMLPPQAGLKSVEIALDDIALAIALDHQS